MRTFVKAKEWASILEKLKILQPIGFPYMGAETPEYKRQLFDELNNYYDALIDIEKQLIYRNIKNELQEEFLAVVTDLSEDNCANTIEIIRRWFNLKVFEGGTVEAFQNYRFFRDLGNNKIATEDEILRLCFKMASVIRFRNIICYQIKDAYSGLLKPKSPQLQPEQANNEQTTDVQSLNQEPQQMELKDMLPEELKTDKVVEVFQKAIDTQLITSSPEGLRWNDTKQLLAYFATKVNEKFNLTVRLDKDGKKTTAWKPFETLFGEKGLKEAKQNWMRLNIRFEPTGFEKVDALF